MAPYRLTAAGAGTISFPVKADRDAQVGLEIGLIPVTIREMLRTLRGMVIPPPRRDHSHHQH